MNTGEQDAPNETPQAEQTPPAGEAPPASAKPAEQETPSRLERAEQEAPSRLERAEQEAPSRPERPEQPGGAPPERRRRRFGRRKVCTFCVDKVQIIDYKDPMKLRRYLSDRGRIEPRRKTGTCAKHQRWLSIALKRARHLALLPYTPEHIRVTGVSTSR